MSLSGQNLSIVIVTLKSEKVIHDCIKSIDQNIPIIIVENSNNYEFKKNLESQYKNLKCVITEKNLGMGAANNKGIKLVNTDYVYILNPDTTLEKNTLENLFLESKKIPDFSIISPIHSDSNFPNWKNTLEKDFNKSQPFQVESVDGYSMLLNKKNLKDLYFDENFFLYLENDDFCLRARKAGGSILIMPNSKINHKGAKAVDPKYEKEIELSRNWHWIWSKFYFNKKHYGFLKAFIEGFPRFFLSIFKYLFFLLTNNKTKKKIYLNRSLGFYNAAIGKSSWYRPNLED
tara:strand:- start:261 stop:1127 length:867 start_codon:yes stop_codon:yes gene_type:complete